MKYENFDLNLFSFQYTWLHNISSFFFNLVFQILDFLRILCIYGIDIKAISIASSSIKIFISLTLLMSLHGFRFRTLGRFRAWSTLFILLTTVNVWACFDFLCSLKFLILILVYLHLSQTTCLSLQWFPSLWLFRLIFVASSLVCSSSVVAALSPVPYEKPESLCHFDFFHLSFLYWKNNNQSLFFCKNFSDALYSWALFLYGALFYASLTHLYIENIFTEIVFNFDFWIFIMSIKSFLISKQTGSHQKVSACV